MPRMTRAQDAYGQAMWDYYGGKSSYEEGLFLQINHAEIVLTPAGGSRYTPPHAGGIGRQ